MKMMKMIAYITLSFFTFTFSVFADDVATQTDWSGGDGVIGPVTDWGDTFDTSTDINWWGMPGEFQLDYSPIKYTIDSDIVWLEVTEFEASGYLTSSVFDVGSTLHAWDFIVWNCDTPLDTDLTVEVRASDDYNDMGSWVEIESSYDDLGDYINPYLHYIQYKITLETSNSNVSPIFKDIYLTIAHLDIDDEEDGNIPTTFALHSAVPNPNNGSATISFALPETCEVELMLYDIKGRKIENLATGKHQPGEYSADVSGLASGVYVYELKADEFVSSKKMVVK